MNTAYIVSFIGDDKPGLVEALSKAIAEHEGNWLHSRLSQLAGKFAGLIEISLPIDKANALESALKALDASGLSVRVTACEDLHTPNEFPVLHLTVIGPDRPGIVREITTELSRHNINIVSMDTELSIAPMSSEHLFEAVIEIETPAGISASQLYDELDEIGERMTLDIALTEKVAD
ncbi:MAG: hypothetical protein CSA53_06795 [Gammaproteobacteria bacterium]|nr:MAG: hypothetical protein CSA53_06795 [Gammaproteobacteria bacterium]